MTKEDFKVDTRYMVTWKAADGKLHPANLYVYRLYNDYLIARMLDRNGLLYKIPYSDIVKIVRQQAVAKDSLFYIPAAVLDEKNWKDRDVMERYSSSPNMGK